MLDVWRVGNKGGTHVRCNAMDGVSDNCALIWVEDTELAGQLCWKVFTTSENRKCSPVKEFFS